MVAATHQIGVSRPASIPHIPLINSLREVSSHMSAFQSSPVAPEGSSCSSAMNAARQIAYWSSLFISMMDSSNLASTSTTASATCTSSASSVPSSQPSSTSTLLLPPHVTTPSSQQALSPSLFGQTTTSLGVIPQPDASSVTRSSTSTSVASTQPILLSSWSLPPYVTTLSSQQVLCPSSSFGQNSKSSVVIPQPATPSTTYPSTSTSVSSSQPIPSSLLPSVTTPSLQQALSPSSLFCQTPTSSGVIPQPATSLVTQPSTSTSVSSSQPIPSSSRPLPPYVTTPSSQQALSPSSLFGQNCTSSEVISQPATLAYQSSPQVRSTSAMSPSSISFLPSTSLTVSAFPPHLSVPSVNARILSSHLPPGPAVIPRSPAASCHEVPSSGQTMHTPSVSSVFQSSELPPVSSTLYVIWQLLAQLTTCGKKQYRPLLNW